jgi:putative isomerase
MMRKAFYISIVLIAVAVTLLSSAGLYAQAVHRDIRTPQYRQLQEKLASGWNTWYNNSVTSEVLLPEAFSINLCLSYPGSGDYLNQIFKASENAKRPETVKLGLRSDDGYYTSMQLGYKGEDFIIETATDGNDELILVTPSKAARNYLVVEAGILWGRPGAISVGVNTLTGTFGGFSSGGFSGHSITVHCTAAAVADAYVVTTAPHLSFSLQEPIGLYTGRARTLAEIKALIGQHRAQQQARVDGYGDLSESFKAMQTILAWNTMYDAANERVITPVSRLWNKGWGGFVLFDWDTYFASYMCSLFNKDLAMANAIEITKAITPGGFIPNYQSPFKQTSWDRSQPPIGSTVILNIYKRYPEKWFLNEVYDELLRWNRWWPKNRDVGGYLCWGSQPAVDSLPSIEAHNLQAAKYESGLDNSPMYDSIPFDPATNTMELADVGLMSFYIADCNALADIAEILGKADDVAELRKRGSTYTKTLGGMWDEKTGIFLNLRLDTHQKSYRLSPTNFYPMLAKACSQAQAERMIKDHYYNPTEFYGEYVLPSIARNDPAFKDNDYWRGRIWGPMNFLVYLGMRNYALTDARADLITKSKALLMKTWRTNGTVFENYNAITGEGNDVSSADGFYHWGALLIFMAFLEKGK